jgi:hypothetical protein
MPRISFKPVKSLIKNIRRLKQGASQCKMAGTGFHSFAKIRAPFHREVEFRTAECSKFGRFFLNSNFGLETRLRKTNVT